MGRDLTVWRRITGRRLRGHWRWIRRRMGRRSTDARRNRLELARLRQQAAEKDELLARVAEIDPDALLVVDRSGRIISVNPAAEQVLGMRRERLLGRLFNAPVRRVMAVDGTPLDAEAYPNRVVLNTGKSVYNVELAFLRPDGRRVILSVNAAPLRSAGGEIAGVAGAIRDITAQLEARIATERAQDAERFLARASAILAASLDHEHTLRSIARLAVPYLADYCTVDLVESDDRVCRVATMHADPRKQELTEALRRFVAGPDRRGIVAAVLRTGEAVMIHEFPDDCLMQFARDAEHLDRLRELGPRAALGVPLAIRDQVLGAMLFIATSPSRRPYDERDLAVARDLGRRAALAVENARLYRAAQRASQAKSDFLAVMSHEFRTPLTTVIGYAELLDAEVVGSLNAEQKKKLGHIRTAAWRLSVMIEEILAFARLDGGGEAVNLSTIEIGALVGEVVALVEPVAAGKGLALRADLPAEPVELETDGPKLRQILIHLLSNAVKFTDTGSIDVTVRRTAAGVAFEVRDTGIGIAAVDLPQVFEPFWQADQTPARRVGGTGLGLGTARGLAQCLGGDIEIESAPGIGSTFRLSLPLRYATSQPEAPAVAG